AERKQLINSASDAIACLGCRIYRPAIMTELLHDLSANSAWTCRFIRIGHDDDGLEFCDLIRIAGGECTSFRTDACRGGGMLSVRAINIFIVLRNQKCTYIEFGIRGVCPGLGLLHLFDPFLLENTIIHIFSLHSQTKIYKG